MMERLRDQIARLRAVTPRLHAVTDEAVRIVQVVESFLGDECKLGLSAQFNFDSDLDRGNGSDGYLMLRYGRLDGQFRLIVSEIESEASGDARCISETAWINCTREMKLRTIEYIPDLLAAIGKKVEFTIQQTEQATVTVKALLQDLDIAVEGGK